MIESNRCVSCGSHEYTQKSGAVICSYCRVPKGGFTVRENSSSNPWSEIYMDRFESLWRTNLLRPELAVRIVEDGKE